MSINNVTVLMSLALLIDLPPEIIFRLFCDAAQISEEKCEMLLQQMNQEGI